MANTFTNFRFTSSTVVTGEVYVPSGNSVDITGLTFYWTDGSYLTELSADAISRGVLFDFTGAPDVVLFDLSNLAEEYPEGNTSYFSAAGVNIPFSIGSFIDGLYYYSATNSTDTENQWLLVMEGIEAKIKTLATTLLNTQCQCKLEEATTAEFVKAKAYQELIYSKVLALGTDSNTVQEIQTALSEINADIQTLTAFLEGTETICGC